MTKKSPIFDRPWEKIFFIKEIYYSKTMEKTDEVFFRGIIKYPIEEEMQNSYTIHLKDLEKEYTKIKLLEKIL